jgi:hypothetical protein
MKIRIVVTRRQAAYTLRWMLFIMTSLTMTLKVVEASAHNTYEQILKTPELAQYSSLAQSSFGK